MSITVDTVQLRFHIKPDYDQQQIQQLQSDLKQSQKNIEAERKVMDKYANILNNTRKELRDIVEERDRLAKQKTHTAEETQRLGVLNQTIEKYQIDIQEAKDAIHNHGTELDKNIRSMIDSEDRLKQYTTTMNIHKMSIAQLSERQKELNRLVNNMNPETDDWKQYKEELDGIRQRIAELRREQLKFHDDMDLSEMSVTQLNERLQALNAAFRDCDPNDEDFKKYADNIKRTQKRLDEMNAALKEADKPVLKFHSDVKLSDLTLEELNERLHALNVSFRNCKPNDPEYERYAKRIQLTKNRIKEMNEAIEATKESLEETNSGWRNWIDNFNKLSWAIEFVSKGFNAVKNWAQPFVDEVRKFSDVFADVAKYTGQTIAEVEKLNAKLDQIDTRTSTEQLNALAGAAGRLGISAEKDIIGFVDAADKINTALGDDLGEGAIDAIGKMTMVFGEDKTKGLNGAMLATGSALNTLGAASSANTGYIADFTSKLAAVAVQARISQTDIMGYASALSQAGETGETAASVLTQFLVKMFSDPAKFAKAAKLDVKEFTELIRTDANQAVLTFLNSMKQAGGFEQLAPMLKSLKMQGTQAVPVLTELANGLDNVTEAQRLARQAYDEGTSIIDEFNQVNNTAQAQLEKTEKQLSQARRELGQRLLPVVTAIESAGVSGTRLLGVIISKAIQWRGAITALVSVMGAYAAVQALVWANQKRIIATEAILKGYHAVTTTLIATRTSVVAAYNLALNLMRGNTIGAARAQITLNAAMSASVFGAIAAAIAAVVVVGRELYKSLTDIGMAQRTLNEVARETKGRMADEKAEMDTLVATVKSLNTSENERKRALDAINGKLMEQHLGNLTEEDIRTGRAKKTLDQYNQSLMDQIENEILLGKIKEARARQMNAENGEFDTSFLQDTKAIITAMGAFVTGKGASYGYDLIMEDYRQTTIEETQKTIDALNQQLEENRRRRKANAPVQYEDVYFPGDTNTANNSTSGSTTTGTDKERRVREKRQRDERREAEAEAKAAYEKEKLMLRQQYQGKKQLQDEWHDKELQAEQQYIDRLAQIRVRYNASEADRMEVANMQLDSITKDANYQREREKQRTAERLADLDRQQGAEEIALAQQRLNGEIYTQQEFNERKLQLEIDYQKKRIVYLKRGSAEYQQAMKQQLQLEQQQADSQRQQQAKDKGRYQQGMNTFLHDQFQDMDSFDKMRELNEQFYEQGRISYQQYQDNLTRIAQEQTEQRTQIQQAAIDATQQLLNSASSFFSAMQSRETAEVDAKYKRMIAAAKKQGKDTSKLEEQQEQEKAAIQKKYADRNFQIQVLQIIGNTAQGISKTIAELGMPWAVPFVAMAAAAGAMQLASAKAAAEQAAGLYTGGYSDDYQQGYTKKGDPRKQAGVIPVHQNEFVANHRAVANPAVRPVLDVIDRHQRVGDIQMLNATRLLEEAYGQGRYRGGYTRNAATAPDGSPDGSAATTTAAADQLLPVLTRIEQNTARSLTVRSLRDEIRHEERLEQNARRQ